MNNQTDLFSKPHAGYSRETSLPAFREGSANKAIQEARITSLVSQGVNTLLQLSEVTGLPQSTVAGRCNDAIRHGSIRYDGTVVYKKRLRKKIVAI